MKNALRTLPITTRNGNIPLSFKLADVKSVAIVGVDLVALMQDGTRLLLPGLAVRILERPSPVLQFQDQQLSGADLFTKVDIDSATLKDAAEALQVPVSEPTSSDRPDATDARADAAKDGGDRAGAASGVGAEGGLAATAADATGQADPSANQGDKGGAEPQAWYQEYGWILGLVGLAGLALGLSGGKKKGKEEDKPHADGGTQPGAPAGDHPATPDDGSAGEKPPAPAPDSGAGDKTVVKISGGIVAGVFNHAETLSVKLYGAQGQELARGELVVGPNGQVQSYRAELPADYVGPVRVVITDGARDGFGFVDEFRQAMALAQGLTAEQAEQLASADFAPMSAIAWRAADQFDLKVSVTPLTELAARLLQAPADPTQPLDGVASAEQVQAIEAAVAQLATTFAANAQINDILGPVVAINADNFAAAAANAQAYGRVLAGMAGLDAASGALEHSLKLLTQGLVKGDDGTLRVAQSVEGAILLAAMQQANTLMAGLADDGALFEKFTLPEVPWATVSAAFEGGQAADGVDALGSASQPAVTVSWDASPDQVVAGQTVALYLLDGRRVASHVLSQTDIDARRVTLAASDYGDQVLGADGVKRLFATVADASGQLIARSELRSYGLVSVEVDGITALSADTGISNSDFITNQPVQAVSGTYQGTLGANTRIEVSADGGRTWVAGKATPAADGTGGTWVSDSLRLDTATDGADTRLLTRVNVPGVNGEQPLTRDGASHAFVLDVTPPEAVVASIDGISAPAPALLPGGFLFTQAAQVIRGKVSGTLADDDRVVVSIDGGNTWIAGESDDGVNWQVAVGFSKHGPGEILARVSDLAGNATAAVAMPFQYAEASLEGALPTQAVEVLAVTDHIGDPAQDPYDFVGLLRPAMSTDDRRPTFSGTVSADLQGDQVLVLVDRVNGGDERLLGYANVAPAEAGQLPAWSFTPVSDIALGRHQILVKVFSPSQNIFSSAYPEGVDADTPGAKSNWGDWDVTVQSISFDGVILPGVDSVNLLARPGHVTDNTQPVLTGTLGGLLAAGESVAIYDAAGGAGPVLLGTAEVVPTHNGPGADWRFEFRDGARLRDGEHVLRAVVQHEDDDGTPRSLLSAGTPTIIISTELPDQAVTIDSVMDDVGVYMGAIASGASTDDTQPTLAGTVSGPLLPGQSLLVRAENVAHPETALTYRPVLDPDSLTWSLAVDPALPVGHYRLTAGVVNGGGTMGVANASFDLLVNSLTFSNLDDAAGPIVGNVFAGNGPFVTDDKSPVLSGRLGVAPGDGEVVRIVSRQAGSSAVLGDAAITADADGGATWRLALGADPDTRLPDGKSILSVRVVHAADDQVRLAVDREINVDVGTPTTLVDINEVRDQVLADNGFVGPLAAGQSTDDRRPLISGVVKGGEAALPSSRAVQIVDRVTAPGGAVTERVVGLATLNADRHDGSWTFTPPEALSIGDHAFVARVVNLANGSLGPEGRGLAVRENRLSFNVVLDHVGALQGNLLDPRVFTQPAFTDDTQPKMSGELGMPLGPNERVAIYDSVDGGPAMKLGVATVTGSSWVFRPAQTLSDSAHVFQARLERTPPGGAPQVLFSASTPVVTIDGAAVPVTQTVLELRVIDNNGANGSQTGAVMFRGSTDDAKPVVSGRLSAALNPGQQVQVFASLAGGGERRLGVATMDGVNWTYRVADALPYGPTTILARVVAVNSGLTSNTLATTINVNSVTLSEISEVATGLNVLTRDGHGTGVTDVTLRGTLASPLLVPTERVSVYARKSGSPLYVPIGMATIAGNGTDWSFHLPERQSTLQTWSEGRHELSVRIEDTASRAVHAVTLADFTVDTQSPRQLASITGYQDQVGVHQGILSQSGVSTDDMRGVIRGTLDAPIDENTRRVMLYNTVDGKLVWLGEAAVAGTDWTFQSARGFLPGVHTVVARVENIMTGDAGASSADFAIRVQQVVLDSIVDSAAPDTNILVPALNGVTAHGQLTFSGRLGAPLAADEKLKVLIDGVEQAGDVTPGGSSGLDWSFALSADAALASGAHTIAAEIVGGNGTEPRVLSAARTVYVDDGAPTATVTIVSARDNLGAGGLSFSGENASGVSSDDPLPLLRGTVSAPLSGGTAVAVYGQMHGQGAPEFLGFANVAADATWTFQVNRELPFGDTSFTARAVNRADPKNLQGPDSLPFVVHEQAVSITALIDAHGAETGDLFGASMYSPRGGIASLHTDDLRPTLRGRVAVPLKEHEAISIFQGATKLGEAEFAPGGDGLSWTFTPQADIALGTARFSAVLSGFDGKSLMSVQTPNVTVANLRPDLGLEITAVVDDNNRSARNDANGQATTMKPIDVLSGALVLDDARPTLSGTLSKALIKTEAVHVYAVDGAGVEHDLGIATTSGTTWSLLPAVALPAGRNTLRAVIENWTDHGEVVRSAPVQVNVVSLSQVSVDGLSALGAVASSRPTIRASVNTDAPDGLLVRVLIDGAQAGTVPVGADGSWSFQPVADLSAGTHRVEYALLNGGAPIAAVASGPALSFIVGGADQPSFNVAMADAGAPIVTDQGVTLLAGTAQTPVPVGMGIMMVVDGKDAGLAAVDASGQKWSYALWAQSLGSHTVSARPINLATLEGFDGGSAQTTVYQNQLVIETPAGALALPGGVSAMVAADGGADVTLAGRLARPLPTGYALQVSVDGTSLGQAQVTESDGGLGWSIAIPSTLQTVGTHQYSVVALPSGTADAGAVSALSAQASLSFTALDSGPNPLLYVAITSLTNERGVDIPATNATIHNRLPAVHGTASRALDPLDQIVVYGRDPAGHELRLGEARMLTATTWEFQVTTALPYGGYTLIAKPENRLTHVANEIASATTDVQLQDVAITAVIDGVGAFKGNVLDSAAHLTDDGTPVISGKLSAPVREGEQYLRVSDTVNGVTTVLDRVRMDASDDPLAWSFQPALPLANGAHTIAVELVSANSAKVQADASVSFVVDASTPAQTARITQVRDDDGPLKGNVPMNGAIDSRRPMVSGKVSAPLSNAQVVRIWQEDDAGNVVYLGQADVKGTNWSWRSDSDMAYGTVRLFATVDNAAKGGQDYAQAGEVHGKPSPVFGFRLLAIENVQASDALGHAVGANTSERQVTLSGKLAAPLLRDEYVEVRDGDQLLGRGTVDEHLNWSFPVGESLGNGRHDFKISILGAGNNAATPLVFEALALNVYDALPDPLQAGLIEAVIALPEKQSLDAKSAFDALAGQGIRPGQSVDGGRIGLFGSLAAAPRVGDLLQVFDNGVLLGTASVSGLRWWYNADAPLAAGEHRFSLAINGGALPAVDTIHAADYPVSVLDGAAIRIDALSSRTDTAQALSGSLQHALGSGEVLGVYRKLNGETIRLGDATVRDSAGDDGRFAWSFAPDASLGLGTGGQTLILQIEGATHVRVAAAQSAWVFIDKAIDAAATILSVAVPHADGLAGIAPGALTAHPAQVVSGSLDRGLADSERVALYDGDRRLGYASVGASGRNWTYVSSGLGNGHHALTAVVETLAGAGGSRSPVFEFDISAQAPGQIVTLASAAQDGAALGSAVALDTKGFSAFVWNTTRTAWDINNIRSTAYAAPVGQAQVPALDFGNYSSAIFPGIPYNEFANYIGSGWFYVDPKNAGVWSFRSPIVDDFAIVSVDGGPVFTGNTYLRNGASGVVGLDVGWHYLRMETGNTGGRGYWRLERSRPGETDYGVMREVQTAPTEQALALGATSKTHHVKLAFSLSAPLAANERLQVTDLTAHRLGDGLRLQFWNLPADAHRGFDDAQALMAQTPPVVSRMADSLLYDAKHPFDDGVVTSASSMLGHASGWFHVAQNQAGTWLFRTTTIDNQVQLKIDGYTLQAPAPDLLAHAQYASMHLEAGWHHLDTTLFQLSTAKTDWSLYVIRPGEKDFAPLTGFAQFEAGVLGDASAGADGAAYVFDATVDDGASHTLVASVVDRADADVSLDGAGPGLVFLANGAFGIVDKAVAVVGDGQTVDFAALHGAINRIDLDADRATHTQGNTLVLNADDVRQADVGSAKDLGSDLLDATFHQMVVLGGEHDVLRFGDVTYTSAWQESGVIEANAGMPAFTVFTAPEQALQLIVQNDVTLDLNGALRAAAHPVI